MILRHHEYFFPWVICLLQTSLLSGLTIPPCGTDRERTAPLIIIGDSLLRNVKDDIVLELNLTDPFPKKVLNIHSKGLADDKKFGTRLYVNENLEPKLLFMFSKGLYSKRLLHPYEIKEGMKRVGRKKYSLRKSVFLRGQDRKTSPPALSVLQACLRSPYKLCPCGIFTRIMQKKELKLQNGYFTKPADFHNATIIFGSGLWDFAYENDEVKYRNNLAAVVDFFEKESFSRVWFRLSPTICPSSEHPDKFFSELRKLGRKLTAVGLQKMNQIMVEVLQNHTSNFFSEARFRILDHQTPSARNGLGTGCDTDQRHFQSNKAVRTDLVTSTLQAW
eukprot:CAMPEP_0177578598 /NCGR_PEP_ID=MMETSP0419_2-20121207/442_1 /TAXON_ID=582737 /ORGANISM="Tetraselmis sp., Strain GSL018" /LENGTH=332 /DNA_ID=CAMNT_0019067069 /DNA_START=24 /DNA_END=1019 /DNA_ORIENTATION=+